MNNQEDLFNTAKISKRTALASLVGLLIIIASIVYGAVNLSSTLKEVKDLTDKKDLLQAGNNKLGQEKIRLEAQVNVLTEKLQEATDFVNYTVDTNWMLTLKSLYSQPGYMRQQEVLQKIVELQDKRVAWKLDGNSIQEGFDSPSFAAFILEENHLLGNLREQDVRSSLKLREILPQVSAPDIGDVVFYPRGYVLFYFKDHTGRPFVIGMTPLGIHALRFDFAKVIGYGKVVY